MSCWKDSEVSKLEDTNHQLREQLQLAIDDVGEKTSELETVSIDSVSCHVVSIELLLSVLMFVPNITHTHTHTI